MKATVLKLVPTALSQGHPAILRGLVLATVLLLSNAPIAARAEAAVKGTADAVQVDARDSSIAEILDALRGSFKLHYRTSVSLNRPVTGKFRGSVVQVVSNLLKNYDYIVKISAGDRIEVIVVKVSSKDSDKVIQRPPPSQRRMRP